MRAESAKYTPREKQIAARENGIAFLRSLKDRGGKNIPSSILVANTTAQRSGRQWAAERGAAHFEPTGKAWSLTSVGDEILSKEVADAAQ